MYVPCKCDVIASTRDALNLVHLDLANYIYEHPSDLKLDLKGFWVSDRTCHTSTFVYDTDALPHSRSWLERSRGPDPRRQLRAQV